MCVYFSGLYLAHPAAFIRVVGSEFVQKYLGEGPRMVRDVFRLAKENAPAIIFIDEIDAIATKRFDAQTGGKRRESILSSLVLSGCWSVRALSTIVQKPIVVRVSFCLFILFFSADREVQRILLELLNQMDGFDQTVNVKV